MIAFENIAARYGQRTVLNGVSAQFRKGAVTGIVGPNGAGKTTLFRTALGLLPATTGTVRVNGKPLHDWPRDTLARTIAYLPQGSDAHWPLLARRLVSLGRMPHLTALRPLTLADEAAINDALARCDALSLASRRMDELSAGERARVLLARALATNAPVLLADEPAAHLDPAHQLQLMDLLREEATRGTAVAVTLHDLSLAARYCDEIMVLDQGRVAAKGAPDIALSDDTLARVFNVAAVRADNEGRKTLVGWRRF
ncbi:MAG TPA: ABC transporter ATP-binding protein [Rhizomicrobium sp.]|jgi:iron complex transport system ATP-binding protein|nr:ABC transporter ATP-binding protein [Rhizomicrobium sp.]